MKTHFIILLLLFPLQAMAVIMACSDKIEDMKKEKEKSGLGILEETTCKGKHKNFKARYKSGSSWDCKTLEDYPCVTNDKLRMVQCDRAWECAK